MIDPGRDAERPPSPWPALVVAGLVLLVGITVLQWVVGAVLGLLKLALLVAVVLAVVAGVRAATRH